MGYGIETNGYCSSRFNFIHYDTIGWVKTDNGEVRQCKCVGIVWEAKCPNKSNCNEPTYEWKVAGIKEHQFGNHKTIPMGTIYRTEEIAQFTSKNYNPYGSDAYLEKCYASLKDLVNKKYGLDGSECVETHAYHGNSAYLSTYTICEDNTVQLKRTDFHIIMDKNGLDVIIPALDRGERYATEEEAKANVKKAKVFTLDDEEEDEVETAKTKTITITLEVDENKIEDIKRMGVVVK